MGVYCITGTNRGLGLEFVRQLAQSGSHTILAAVRALSSDLGDLNQVASPTTHVLECDTGSIESIQAFATQAAQVLGPDKTIDFLINNAGINLGSSQNSLGLDPDHLTAMVNVNVVGPAKMVEFLLGMGLLSSHVRVLNMTSGLGSMQCSSETNPKCAGYSVSKASLNMLTIHQSKDLREKLLGAVVIAMDPGWVKTRLGGRGAILEPHESISNMLDVLHELGDQDNGKFYQRLGQQVPW